MINRVAILLSICMHFLEILAHNKNVIRAGKFISAGLLSFSFNSSPSFGSLNEVRGNYFTILKNGNTNEISEFNHNLMDFVFGKLTVMYYWDYYDPVSGIKLLDDMSWRSRLKDLNARGKNIYASEKATQNEIRRLVRSLRDPYSSYISPEELQEFEVNQRRNSLEKRGDLSVTTSDDMNRNKNINKLKEKFLQNDASIGIEIQPYIDRKINRILGAEVIAVYPKSPAEDVGLKVGDVIVQIGNKSIRQAVTYTLPSSSFWSAEAATSTSDQYLEDVSRVESKYVTFVKSLLKGQAGTAIRLGILPNRPTFSILHNLPATSKVSDRLYHVAVPRESNTVSSTSGSKSLDLQQLHDPSLAPDMTIAYIRMKSFSESVGQELTEALKSNIVKDSSLLLLDLRNNFGGSFGEALKSSATILQDPKAVICYTITPSGLNEHGVVDEEFETIPHLSSLPIAVLVNEGTASSSEILSAALRDNGRAVLIGSRTYGKSRIQHVFPLPDGGALKLTVAEYLTPKKKHVLRNLPNGGIGDTGLTPDILCTEPPSGPADRDPCVRVAIDIML